MEKLMTQEERLSTAATALAGGNYALAIEHSEQVIELDWTCGQAYAIAGAACVSMDDPQRAKSYMLRAVQYESENAEYHFILGSVLLNMEDRAGALTHYVRARELGCGDEVLQQIYYAVGMIHAADGKLVDALACFDSMDKLGLPDKNREEVLLRRIHIHAELGDYSMSEEYARQYMLYYPSRFTGWQLLVTALLGQGKLEEARALMAKAEGEFPGEKERAKIIVTRIQILRLLARIKPEQAAELLEQTLAGYDWLLDHVHLFGDGYVRYTLEKAEVLLWMGRADQAQELVLSMSSREEPEDEDDEEDEADREEQEDEEELHLPATEEQWADMARFILLGCCGAKEDYAGAKKHAEFLTKSDNLMYCHHGYYMQAFAAGKLAGDDREAGQEVLRLYQLAIAHYRNALVEKPGDTFAVAYRARANADIGQLDKALELAQLLPTGQKEPMVDYIKGLQKGGE